MKYTKPDLSYLQQIQLLKNRGLIISDYSKAIKYLKHIGYYRLSAYMIPYYQNKQEHQFIKSTDFDDILNLYIFDRKLRILLLEAIERIEVSFRSIVTDYFVDECDSHAYLDQQYFDTRYNHDWLISKIQNENEKEKSSEVFINHYKKKYSTPELPPLWMCAQLLSFKEMVLFYQNIKVNTVKTDIAQSYGLSDKVLISWMRSLSDLRNLCAHHARVWNRSFGSKPRIPKKNPAKWLSRFPNLIDMGNNQKISPRNSLYYQIVIIWYFLIQTSSKTSWLKRFKTLCKDYQVDMRCLGFPQNWQSDPYWQGA